ncbi:YolD-like family protein [Paenibacillus dauci]|uniref:YolD-like family protein n=1 Tax=Paenibacillus dauci TaxID=1567106 RepID=UPI0006966B75|nr:YolD-like family protein [Paenibacillus dauci]
MNDFSKMKRDPNKTWSSSFILPEHRDRLQEWLFAQEDVPRPILGPDQLEELNQAMHQHLQDHQPITITYYKDKRIQRLRGILHSCDPSTRVLGVYNVDYEPVRIRISDILSITT